jgi:hypothetical protein
MPIVWKKSRKESLIAKVFGRLISLCISEFQRQFLKLAEKIKSLPQEILVKKEETFKLLKPITSELGIKLRSVKRLRMLEDAQFKCIVLSI